MSYWANLDCDGLLREKQDMHYWRRETFGNDRERPLKSPEPEPKRISYLFCSCGAEFDLTPSELSIEHFGQPTASDAWRHEHEQLGHKVSSTYRYEHANH